MRNIKLFSKIFLYTFLVMLFVTVMAHVFLYVLAPQMTVSTNHFVEGTIIESDVNTGILIKSAIDVYKRQGETCGSSGDGCLSVPHTGEHSL